MRAAKILVLALIVGQASEVNAAPWKMALQLWGGTCSLISNAVEISYFTGWLQPECTLEKSVSRKTAEEHSSSRDKPSQQKTQQTEGGEQNSKDALLCGL